MHTTSCIHHQYVLLTIGDYELPIDLTFYSAAFSATLSVMQIKYGCHVNSVFTSVICLAFDLVHSKTPLFPKETLIDHFYV